MWQSALTLTILLFVVNIFTVSNSKELENSLEMNDEEPKPGTGNSDSTSFVYSQSYDVMFFMFLPQHKPLLSRIFPREIKTRNCFNIPTWKAQNSSCLTRVLLKFCFHLHGTFLSEACCSAKSLQSCPTLCNLIDGSPPGSPVSGILQARTLE